MGQHKIPDKPWEIISVDYVTDLPKSQGKDAILVAIDYHSKGAHFLKGNKTDTSEDWANLYIEGIWKLHGTGSKIVSDRGPQFASEFTRALHKGLNIQTALSTAHHPQTDGQTERLNQTMEAYLRIFTSYHQEDWADLLPFAEFAYNNQKHSTTGMSPFFIQYGYDPTYEINANPINKVPAVKDRLNMMKELREETVVMLQ